MERMWNLSKCLKIQFLLSLPILANIYQKFIQSSGLSTRYNLPSVCPIAGQVIVHTNLNASSFAHPRTPNPDRGSRLCWKQMMVSR
jgi:hypothetical protein